MAHVHVGCWGQGEVALQVSPLPVLLISFLMPPLLQLFRQCPLPYTRGQVLVLPSLPALLC